MNVKQIAMATAIAIMFALIIGVGIDTFYESPRYEDYCNATIYPKYVPPASNVDCAKFYEQHRQQIDMCYQSEGQPIFDYTNEGCEVFKECDMCSKEFNTANKIYNRNVFFITVPIGLAAIIGGVYWAVEFMGSGLMFGGILIVIYGTARYFSDMNKYTRFLTLVIEFIVLIFIGYKKLVEKKNAKKKRK